jgi:site-specific recombinase XerD
MGETNNTNLANQAIKPQPGFFSVLLSLTFNRLADRLWLFTYTKYAGGIMSAVENQPAAAHLLATSSIPEALEAWEAYMIDQGRSPHTVKAFTADILMLHDYLSQAALIGAITTEDLNKFLHWLREERGVPCSPKSYARRITSIKSFFRWLARFGALPANPAEKILQKSVISPLPEILTREELEHVLETARAHTTASKPDHRPYALTLLLLTTGIKKGECLALSVNHLDLADAEKPFLMVRYANPSSRFKERKIDLTPEWVAVYKDYLAQYKSTEKIFPWSPRRLEYILEDLGREAGLTKHLSFDMCRWTSALTDWLEGVDKDTIRQKLGISKIQWRELSAKLKQLSGETPAPAV